jgi:hypothetical protein
MGAIEYNKKTSAELGWLPEWFGASNFDNELIEKIKKFQKKHKLDADGYCGPGTFRRIFNHHTQEIVEEEPPPGKDFIICNATNIPIGWDKVVHWTDEGGLSAKKGCYREHYGTRDVWYFVNHWDVCLSARRCQSVLDKRGISVHFLLDNDGTIYQTMDTSHIGWHAGGRTANNHSIGIEISNAYYPKYQSWYEKNGFGKRPLIKQARVHGKRMSDHLGFYPVQIEALKALWKAISVAYDLPLDTPRKDDGSEYGHVHPDTVKGNFRGFIHHYNLTRKKIDCGGLDITKHIDDLK